MRNALCIQYIISVVHLILSIRLDPLPGRVISLAVNLQPLTVEARFQPWGSPQYGISGGQGNTLGHATSDYPFQL
jgi:hypothetical protein